MIALEAIVQSEGRGGAFCSFEFDSFILTSKHLLSTNIYLLTNNEDGPFHICILKLNIAEIFSEVTRVF